MTNNPPHAVVELDKETYEFLVENCEANLHFGLGMLQSVSRPTGEKLVENIEKFKRVKTLLERSKL